MNSSQARAHTHTHTHIHTRTHTHTRWDSCLSSGSIFHCTHTHTAQTHTHTHTHTYKHTHTHNAFLKSTLSLPCRVIEKSRLSRVMSNAIEGLQRLTYLYVCVSVWVIKLSPPLPPLLCGCCLWCAMVSEYLIVLAIMLWIYPPTQQTDTLKKRASIV